MPVFRFDLESTACLAFPILALKWILWYARYAMLPSSNRERSPEKCSHQNLHSFRVLLHYAELTEGADLNTTSKCSFAGLVYTGVAADYIALVFICQKVLVIFKGASVNICSCKVAQLLLNNTVCAEQYSRSHFAAVQKNHPVFSLLNLKHPGTGKDERSSVLWSLNG